MFRPDDIGKIFGQDHLQDILITWVNDLSTIPQSILFSGPYGVGKTTIARILAQKLTSFSKDLIEINAADARGIDDVRSWAESTRFSPFGTSKVYIIDELHQMTKSAQSALLKVIEEPPKGVHFFLCTTEPSGLISPIRSRCTQLELRLLTLDDTCTLLAYAFKQKLNPQICKAIHEKSDGHARDAVKMAEMAVLSNVVDVDELDRHVGLGFSEIQKQIKNLMYTGRIHPHTANQLTQISDAQYLGRIIDEEIDLAAIQGNPVVTSHYFEFIQMRSLRKEYKISAKEQIIHLIAKFNRE